MPAVHKQELKKKLEEIWQSGGAGREVLREELVRRYFRGLERYIGTDFYSSKHLKQRGTAPFIFGDWPTWGLRPRELEGKMLFAVGGEATVLEVDPETYDVEILFGEFMVHGSDLKHLRGPQSHVDYDPVNDRILITDSGNNRILLVDRQTKEVLRVISEAKGYGPFSDPRKAFFNPWNDYNSFTVADLNNHIVYELDFNGDVINSFGTRGVTGSGMDTTQTNLNKPTCAFPSENGVYISDWGNNRCFFSDWSIVGKNNILIPFLHPYQFILDRRGIRGLMCSPEATFATISENYLFWWWYGERADWINLDDYDPDMVMLEHWFTMWHFNWRVTMNDPRTNPKFIHLFRQLSLSANETSLEYPFLTLGADKVTVYTKSSQSATLRILVYKPRGALGGWDGWEIYDSVSMTANTLVVYPITGLQPIMGVQIVMGGTAGTVDAWVGLSRET